LSTNADAGTTSPYTNGLRIMGKAVMVTDYTVMNGLSASFVPRLSGGASRLAALLLPQILPVSSVVTPCHPGAALRGLCNASRFQGTSSAPENAGRPRRRPDDAAGACVFDAEDV